MGKTQRSASYVILLWAMYHNKEMVSINRQKDIPSRTRNTLTLPKILQPVKQNFKLWLTKLLRMQDTLTRDIMASSAYMGFFASKSKATAENYTGLNSMDTVLLSED